MLILFLLFCERPFLGLTALSSLRGFFVWGNMVKDFNSNTENKEEWFTPGYIIDALGSFDLDPCTSREAKILNPIAITNYTYDGLINDWIGRVWCNPPYGKKTFEWIKKLAAHGNGIALIFARTETKGFHSEIWEKADAVFFFEGRLKFYHKDGSQGGTANAPSCLVAYGRGNVLAVRNSGLKGKLVILN